MRVEPGSSQRAVATSATQMFLYPSGCVFVKCVLLAVYVCEEKENKTYLSVKVVSDGVSRSVGVLAATGH